MNSLRVLSIFSFLALLLPLPAVAQLKVTESDASIRITNGGTEVLVYHKTEVDPPAGANPLYRRSGFIHPLRAPNGGVVTGIHPKDHVHHLGLWHAWVKTRHKGRSIDFWNLKAGEGTVRYARTKALRDNEPGTVGFTVVQEHVILPDEVVLEEDFRMDVSVHEGRVRVDHTTMQKNVSDAPLELPAYRYGGAFAYRGPHHWSKDNSTVRTSEGKGRDDGHATRARWCSFSGPTQHGVAGLAILCHPDNHDAPQRQRIWPSTTHDGAVFYNWVPTQEHAWAIRPGETSTLRYRIVLVDEAPSVPAIEAWYKAYE